MKNEHSRQSRLMATLPVITKIGSPSPSRMKLNRLHTPSVRILLSFQAPRLHRKKFPQYLPLDRSRESPTIWSSFLPTSIFLSPKNAFRASRWPGTKSSCPAHWSGKSSWMTTSSAGPPFTDPTICLTSATSSEKGLMPTFSPHHSTCGTPVKNLSRSPHFYCPIHTGPVFPSDCVRLSCNPLPHVAIHLLV